MAGNNYNRAGGGGRGGGSRGGQGGRGTGNSRGANYQQHQSGGNSGQGSRGGHTQMANNPPSVHRPVQGQEGANRLPVAGPTSSGGSTGAWGRGGTWSDVVARNGAPPPQPQPQPQAATEIDIPDVQSLEISVQQPPSIQGNEKGRIVPMKRPDSGGKSGKRLPLWANFFLIKYNLERTMLRYDVQIEPEKPPQSRFPIRPLKISDLCILWEKLCSDNRNGIPKGMAVFDGHSVFSSVELPTGKFKLELLDGEFVKAGSYMFTIKFVNEVQYSVLDDCMSGVLEYNPRDVLQGFDLVIKENPSRNGINFGRSTFPFQFRREDDLGCGVAALRGFQQSLKLSSQGLNLVLDTSVLPFCKSMPVVDYLKENLHYFRGVNDVNKLGRDVERALKGLEVTVTHRATKQKSPIMGLTKKSTRFLSFPCVDREGKNPTTQVMVVDYFAEKYEKDIQYKDIPCLELGNRKDAVPMEFCVIAPGQSYPEEQLDYRSAKYLRKLSMAPPNDRSNTICEIVRSEYGPFGGQVAQNFGLEVDNMTELMARVLEPPTVKLGNSITAKPDQDKCQWNLYRKTLVKGVPILRWALLDFSAEDHNRLNQDKFVHKLMSQCKSLGIRMEDPLAICSTNMDQLRSIDQTTNIWHNEVDITQEVSSKGWLQGMNLVMKENNFRHRISFGQTSYPREYKSGYDLCCGVAAFRGFQVSLKPTSQGLSLCLDYSDVALCKRMPVIDNLKENIPGFQEVHDIWGKIGDVTKAPSPQPQPQPQSKPQPQAATEIDIPASLSLFASGSSAIKFNGLNYTDWSEQIHSTLDDMNLDIAIVSDEKPAAITETSSEDDKSIYGAWERSNMLSLYLMRMTMAENIKPLMPKTEDAREFMRKVKEYSQSDLADKSIVGKFKPGKRNKGKKSDKTPIKVSEGQIKEKKIRCFFCNEEGHAKAACPKRNEWFEKKGTYYADLVAYRGGMYHDAMMERQSCGSMLT